MKKSELKPEIKAKFDKYRGRLAKDGRRFGVVCGIDNQGALIMGVTNCKLGWDSIGQRTMYNEQSNYKKFWFILDSEVITPPE